MNILKSLAGLAHNVENTFNHVPHVWAYGPPNQVTPPGGVAPYSHGNPQEAGRGPIPEYGQGAAIAAAMQQARQFQPMQRMQQLPPMGYMGQQAPQPLQVQNYPGMQMGGQFSEDSYTPAAALEQTGYYSPQVTRNGLSQQGGNDAAIRSLLGY